MKIIVACGSLPFGPSTTSVKSLGGSETAALMASRELAKRGHDVTLFCNLPPAGQPDAVENGFKDEFGVRWLTIEMVKQYAMVHAHDLYIAVRDPNLLTFSTYSRKKVLWAHDIFTKRGMQRALDNMAWTFDEIWAVSEWHKHQINEATGYPLDHIVALRNGIVPVEPLVPPEVHQRDPKQLVYAARPERGLENLIKPSGIMERLPDYTLVVAMYEHFPENMRPYYEMIFKRMAELPNVRYVGGKSQPELRQIIKDSVAYIYPTQFEETSCILARECIEQCTPMFTTFVGALPETLGEEGIFFEPWLHSQGITEPERGSVGWCQLFAEFVKQALANPEVVVEPTRARMAERTDLYWDGVAELMEQHATPKPVKTASRIWSLIQSGDVMAARALFQDKLAKDYDGGGYLTPFEAALGKEITEQYAFLDGGIEKHYDDMYAGKSMRVDSELVWVTQRDDPRWNAIDAEIAKLKPGTRVFEMGCGAGHVLVPLAFKYPQINFIGCDFSATSIEFIKNGIDETGLDNLLVFVNDASGVHGIVPCDAVICTEVLEHVAEPWKLLQEVEALTKPGGRVILTTPFGAWEPITFEQPGKWSERAHLWEIDQTMFEEMFDGPKPNQHFSGQVQTIDQYGHPVGNLVTVYDADHRPIKAVDPLAKAMRHISRQTVAAAVIAYNNEDTIIRMLNSILHNVQFVRIAMGPATDHTREYVENWFREHPMIRHEIVDVPKIEPYKFGFDDARNISAEGLDENFDWFFWIDTDEYLSGNWQKYLRHSSMQGYLTAQHHFTVEPRQRPAEMDRPARLLKTGEGYKARGHIHEHFELPEGGPGRCYMPPDIDIGHTGYVNEEVRRGRFKRNYEFLKWDHETEGNERKLHKFLWFRDLVHSMRFAKAQGHDAEAEKLAHEAVEYYHAHTEDMGAFGPGIFMALQYLSECNTILGKGIPMKVAVTFDDRSAELQGVWNDYAHFDKVLRQFVETEFKERESRYW